ncbi:MAG TPA: MFS transporter [Rhodobacteraceae bacterium]|nr:MFS transporter [Alphaproteobacteria bacterium]MDG0983772.1 MFS transporter [Tateyamaria sp.]HAB38270.1 MFS transporter [Paracoccaceae bacterium]MCH9833139.1 MFS transporter [Alphaproteobacteria bacterium]MDG1419735.1 MFS transporter [Tateyamaria sp.]
MNPGIVLLVLGYVLSQFFRAFLAVLATPIKTDIGISPEILANASGLWFLAFAAMQIPIGWSLDTIGPRRTAASLFLIGAAGGSAIFAVATSAFQINMAMLLIGVGCSPVLMASYYIFAKEFPPKQFATLAAVMIGFGTLGNVSASVPLNWAVDLIGWRQTLWLLSAICFTLAIGLFLYLQDPTKVESYGSGSVLDLLRIPALWLIIPIMFVSYAPAAAIRGLWISPFLQDVYGLNQTEISHAALAMSCAMVLGVFIYGPLDRILGSRKWVVFGGNFLAMLSVAALYTFPSANVEFTIALICSLGLFGASFPVIIAHARSFFPPHLIGRGVTLLNLFGIGGVGLMQFASGKLHVSYNTDNPSEPYNAIFGFLTASILIGLIIYFFSQDTKD